MRSQQGDTIVEVILAVAIFSMVAVGAIAMMNRGVSVVQRSLEITQVRSEIKAQSEALRYIHQEYTGGDSSVARSQWRKMLTDLRQESAASFDAAATNSCPSAGGLDKPYIIDIRKIDSLAAIVTNIEPDGSQGGSLPYAHIDSSGSGSVKSYGLWIEAVQKDSSQNYVDFYIRACWSAVGQSVPVTLGTIVRLYAPN